jgi:Repeat of unknown function (DUF5648)/Fibronectin type III domain
MSFPAGSAGVDTHEHHFIAQFSTYLPFSKRETKSMKRTVTLLGLSLMLLATVAFAQRPMDDANERAVRITQGPKITNITGESATIHWTTNTSGANHVRYRVAGSNHPWQSAYHQGGGTNHSLQLTGLEPNKTYEWQILTRDGDLRTQGQFQTARNRHGHGADVNGGSYPQGRGSGDRDHDADDNGYGNNRDHGNERDNNAYGGRVQLYRGVNRQGGHIYSANAGDVTNGGYQSEGTAGSLMSSQQRGTTALYRLSSGGGDSFLTRDSNERDNAIRQGLQDQGVVGYIATAQRPGTQPLYRLYNPGSGQHFYTTSEPEREQAMRLGLKDEGVAGFVWQ